MNILAVDDDIDFLHLLAAHFEAINLSSYTLVTSADEAIRTIHASHAEFECFVLDISMPEKDGITLCREIRSLPQHASTPILMLTALSDKRYIDAAFQAGANDYLAKPIEAQELHGRLNMVGEVVSARHSSKELIQKFDERRSKKYGHLKYSDKMALLEVDGVTTMQSLENYLFRLGRFRSSFCSAIPITVANSHLIFVQTDPDEYVDILAETATAIIESFPSGTGLLAFCGYGNFCWLNTTPFQHDLTEINTLINDTVAQRLGLLMGGFVDVPRVELGGCIQGGLRTVTRPTAILELFQYDFSAGTSSNKEAHQDWKEYA